MIGTLLHQAILRELAQALGRVDAAFVDRLQTLVQRAGLPSVAPVLDAKDNAARWLDLMRVDKKAEAGEIRFVVIDPPGRAVMCPAPDDTVARVVAESTAA